MTHHDTVELTYEQLKVKLAGHKECDYMKGITELNDRTIPLNESGKITLYKCTDHDLFAFKQVMEAHQAKLTVSNTDTSLINILYLYTKGSS